MSTTGFHLPHNAIIPEEIKFIIGFLDVSREFYLYDELKALLFENEIKKEVFQTFHPGMYANFMQRDALREMYNGIKNGTLKYDDVKRMPYTDKKTLNGVWNEQARDYFEFFAFTGLLPSYYKGRALENEKRHYIGYTLKKYKKNEITFADILFNMKFRNASKNSDTIEQYNVRNRPFVVILKILDILKKKGYREIDGLSVSYLLRNIKDEDKIDPSFIQPLQAELFPQTVKRELARGVTFLKRYLLDELHLPAVNERNLVLDLTAFDIRRFRFEEKAVFIGDIFDDVEVTPLLIRALMQPQQIQNAAFKEKLIRLGLINDAAPLYAFNIDTDLPDRNLVTQVMQAHEEPFVPSARIEATPLYKEGNAIAQSGNGTAYELFLYHLLKNKFGEKNVKYLGANTVGERLSDILWDIVIQDEDNVKTKLRIIVEAKSGGAITAFDERKEKDNILNTLSDKRYKADYDGTWYMVVDSNCIPQEDVHGGFREGSNKLSFKQKLLKIQSSVMPQTLKLMMVTAFSYDEFMKFIDSIEYCAQSGCLSKIQAPDFWTWSPKFIGTSYVTIRA